MHIRSLPFIVAADATPAACPPQNASLWCVAKSTFDVASVFATTLVAFPRAQAEVRAARAQTPRGTYDPAAAMSTIGQLRLESMAAAYEKVALSRHLIDGIVVPKITVDATTLVVRDDRSAMADSAYHSSQLLAAMACKYAVTRDPADLQTVTRLATGVVNLLTLTSHGTVTDPRTGRVLDNVDTPVRAYIAADSTAFRNGSEFVDSTGAYPNDVFIFDGALPGASGTRYLIKARVSIDQIDAILFGLSKTAAILDKTHAAPALRQIIAEAAARFGRRLMQNQGKVLDVDGAVAPLADTSNSANPVSVMNRLSWLKSCAMMSGDMEMATAYDTYFSQTAGSALGDGFGLLADTTSPLLARVREVIEAGVPDFNDNLLMLPIEPLFALETDLKKRGYYRAIYNDLIAPVVSGYRVPFFDEVDMMTNGTRLTLGARVNGTLAQFRDDPLPPTVAAPTPDNPPDPLFALLSRSYSAAFPNQTNPFYVGGVTYDFGPELSARPNSIERPNRFRTRVEQNLGVDAQTGHVLLQEFAGEDFLLNYWYGRYEGVVSGSKLSATPGAPPPIAPQRRFTIDVGRGCGGT